MLSDHEFNKAQGAFRFLVLMALFDADPVQAEAACAGRAAIYRTTPEVVSAFKAAVGWLGAGGNGSVAQVQNLVGTFLQLVRARTVRGRLPLRLMPPNTSMLAIGSGAAAAFLAEGQPLRISKLALERETVALFKLGASLVWTKELLLSSNPLAERAFAQALLDCCVAYEDLQFLDPGIGPVAGTSPGSITYGLTGSDVVDSSGAGATEIRADLKRLFAPFTGSDAALDRAYVILSAQSAVHLSLLCGEDGGLMFPKIGARGGEICGVPAVVSAACTLAGSPGENFAVLVDPSRVLYSESPAVEIESASHATLQMDSAPGDGEQPLLVSLWSSGLKALKIVKPVSWRLAAGGGCTILRGMAY